MKQLWNLFKYAELTEVVRLDNKLLTDLLNKVEVDNTDDDVERLLKTRLISEPDPNYPKDALRMHVRRE